MFTLLANISTNTCFLFHYSQENLKENLSTQANDDILSRVSIKNKKKKKEKCVGRKGELQIIPAVGIIRKIYLRGDKKQRIQSGLTKTQSKVSLGRFIFLVEVNNRLTEHTAQ